MNSIPKIAITMGDPGSIGPEVVVKALTEKSASTPISYLVIGVEKVLKDTASALNKKISFNKIKDANKLRDAGFYLLEPLKINSGNYVIGKPDAVNGRVSIEILKTTVQVILNKQVDAVVTAPVSKQAINEVGIKFIGHTEFFAQHSRTRQPVMMFVTEQLKVALLTTHLAYKKVSLYLTKPNIISNLQVCSNGLQKYFGIANPRIGVCGLNPHAGEGGFFGREEKDIIQPAIETARAEGVNCSGPFPADTVFSRAIQGEFDIILALYHDQGLIPVKTISHYKGANVTLGLPFIRTSVMHGTAFDIAGKGIADSSSMQVAIQTALQMYRNNSQKLF